MLQTYHSKYSTLFSHEKIYRQQTWSFGGREVEEKRNFEKSENAADKTNNNNINTSNLSYHPFSVGECARISQDSNSKSVLSDRTSYSASYRLLQKRMQLSPKLLRENTTGGLMMLERNDENVGNKFKEYDKENVNNIRRTKKLDKQFSPIIRGIQCQQSTQEVTFKNQDKNIRNRSTVKFPPVATTSPNAKKEKFNNNTSNSKKSKTKKKLTKFTENFKYSSKRNIKEKISFKFFNRNKNSGVNTVESKRIDENTNIGECSQRTSLTSTVFSSNRCEEQKEERDEDKKNIVSVSPCKRKKIYYSERQSDLRNGVPSVPPCTPAFILHDSVSSLADLKSQRNVVQKLLKIETKQREKEKELNKKAKEYEEKRKIQETQQLIQKQRRQIYYLNEMMTKSENNKFLEFKLMQSGAPI